MTRILGIDPGLASTGYGIIDADGHRFVHVTHGVIETPSNRSTGERLLELRKRVKALLRRFAPAEASLERLYFGRNTTTALPVAEARGVVLCALAEAGVPCYEYPPATVKQSVVGRGAAAKDQIQNMIRLIFRLGEPPVSTHGADALAVAFCHSTRSHLGRLADREAGEARNVQQRNR